jgi:hypothetical protein
LTEITEKRINECWAINVFKCIHGLSKSSFDATFAKIKHHQNTRGNGLNLVIPRAKTESGKKSFAYQGALLYNELLKEEQLVLLKARLRKCNA